jgi:co-chaperonin GroES (HSP10)
MNTSGLKPLGRAVLLQHYEPERKQGLIVIPESVQERQLMLEQRAIVIDIGEHAWPDEPPRAKVGDKVLVSRYAGSLATGPLDGQKYLLINDRDIYAAITAEKE